MKRRTVSFAIVVIACFGFADGVGCASHDEDVGTSSAKITRVDPAGPAMVSFNGGPSCAGGPGIEGSETSAVWAAGGTGDPAQGSQSPQWLVGLNSVCAPGLGGLGRAIDNGSAPSWSYCNMIAAPPITTGCGPGGGSVPFATGFQNGNPITQTAFAGDPYLASTRIAFTGPSGTFGGDIVAYTNIAASNASGSNPNMVVAAVSFDSGLTFTSNLYVNEGHCDDGSQDQQAAAFDTTVFPPRLWVTWRWNSKGTFGACVRGFTTDPSTRTITPLGPPTEVQNLDRTPFYGVGGLIVRAQNGRVSIVYSNSDHHYDCPSPPTNEMKFLSVSSDDNGVTWTPSTLILDTNTFAPCLANNNVSNEMRTFGFINDNLGDYYAAFLSAKDTIQIFLSHDQGNTWTPTPIHQIGPGFNGSLIQPFLASDGASRIGLFFYGTDTATDTIITPTFEGAKNAVSNLWDPVTAAGPSFPIDVAGGPCSQNTNQCRTLGDYSGIAAKIFPGPQRQPPLTYLPAWSAFPPGRPSVVGEERPTAVMVGFQ
jgi:hypothetical protein